MINAVVKGQGLKINHPKVVADTIAYLEMSVEFRTPDWDGLVKYVHFNLGDEHYSFELVDDKITQDMHLDLPEGEWEVYIHGSSYQDGHIEQRITTEPVTLYVDRTGTLDGEPFPELSGSVGEQVVAKANEALDVANDVKRRADNGEFKGEKGDLAELGVDCKTGIKGYWVKNICKIAQENNYYIVFHNTDVREEAPKPTTSGGIWRNPMPIPYAEGDEFSIITPKDHYHICGKICWVYDESLNGSSGFSCSVSFYTEINWDAGDPTDNNDYSFFVPSKPDVGIVTVCEGSVAEGYKTRAGGDYSHSEGSQTQAVGSYSHAEGLGTWAGYSGHAEGSNTKAIGKYAHAEGFKTEAKGGSSHAEGELTKASGNYSHAEGKETVASAFHTHAEGWLSKATANNAHAEGHSTTASGGNSHAEGEYTLATAPYSHAEGYNTQAGGSASHSEGNQSNASGSNSHAEGGNTTASGAYSHAEGNWTTAEGLCSHAEGDSTKATGEKSHAEGHSTEATNVCAHAEGFTTKASGMISHAEGRNTQATGDNSHAEGNNTKASGDNSHAEGRVNTASGYSSHAEGDSTFAIGTYSHAEGYYTRAEGESSHAGGSWSSAKKINSFAHGDSCSANSDKSAAFGFFTKTSETQPSQFAMGECNAVVDDAILMVGNGTSDSGRSNAFTVISQGRGSGARVSLKVGNTIITESQLQALLRLI